MTVSLILAVARNNTIGRHGSLIWHIPEDLERVKRRTMGHHLLVGRKTFESIGRPLPGRTTIVITRQKPYAACGCPSADLCFAVGSVTEAISTARARGEKEAFVFGGAQIYRQSLKLTDRIYMTRIHREFAGDAFFQELGPEWLEASREEHLDAAPYPYSIVIYKRAR